MGASRVQALAARTKRACREAAAGKSGEGGVPPVSGWVGGPAMQPCGPQSLDRVGFCCPGVVQ